MVKEWWHKFSTCRSEKFSWQGFSDDRCELHRWHRGNHACLVVYYTGPGQYPKKFTKIERWERGAKNEPDYPIKYRMPFNFWGLDIDQMNKPDQEQMRMVAQLNKYGESWIKEVEIGTRWDHVALLRDEHDPKKRNEEIAKHIDPPQYYDETPRGL